MAFTPVRRLSGEGRPLAAAALWVGGDDGLVRTMQIVAEGICWSVTTLPSNPRS